MEGQNKQLSYTTLITVELMDQPANVLSMTKASKETGIVLQSVET